VEPEFFANFGLYVARNFLDPALCAEFRSQASVATGIAATVRREGSQYAVDEEIRRTKVAEVSEQSEALIQERLLALKPVLDSHFGVATTECRRPQFLVYRPGDFFRAHADSSRDPAAPAFSTRRRVSIVIFLNGEGLEQESYAGGSLVFYDLMGDPRARDHGFPLTAEAGLLVAFRSELVHAVIPVTRGTRFTIVSWLL
jgi:predicted 2-oxoglutarate/Fe(II)-dependent dioxygenase YbiX